MNAVRRLLDGSNAVGKYPHYRATCRHHDDVRDGGNPSFEIDFVNRIGVVDIYGRCRSCGANLLDLANALDIDWPDIQYAIPAFIADHPPIVSRPWRLPSDAQFAEWSKRLLERPERIEWLTEVRGISHDMIEHYQIGWDDTRRRWTFPIFEWPNASSPFLDPIIVNALWYPLDPMADGRRKMCCWGGWPTDLYPGPPRTPKVIVAEGPLDALVSMSHGISAVSGTTGASHWEPSWTSSFAGLDVVVAYDCDDAGRKGARAMAAELASVAKRVTVIDLDPTQHEGYDLTDWFGDGRTIDELLSMIRHTRRKPRPKPRLSSIVTPRQLPQTSEVAHVQF